MFADHGSEDAEGPGEGLGRQEGGVIQGGQLIETILGPGVTGTFWRILR